MAVTENKFSTEKEGPWSFLACLRHVGVWLGFAFLSFWATSFLAFEGMLHEDDSVGPQVLGSTHTPFFFAATLVAGAALLLLALFASKEEPVRRAFIPDALHALVAAVGAAVSGVMAAYVELAPGESMVVPLVLGAVWGLCFALMLLAWARLLSVFDLRSILVLVCAAMCPQWLLLLLVMECEMEAKVVMAVALPIGAFVCYLASARKVPGFGSGFPRAKGEADDQVAEALAGSPDTTGAAVAASASASASSAASASSQEAGSSPKMILARLDAMVFMFAAVIQFVWTFCVKQKAGGLQIPAFTGVFITVTVVLVVVFVLAFVMMQRENVYRLELMYRAVFLFALLGAASLPLSSYNLFLSYLFIYMSYSLLFPALYSLGFGYASMCQADVVRVLGSLCGLQYLGFFVGFGLETLLGSLGVAELAAAPSYAALAAVGILCAAFAFVFPEKRIDDIFPIPIAMSYASLDEKCAVVARLYGLSPRETEVLTLLARGRNAAHIADELYISRNTVGTHRRNIYRKLGVHDQQELLSLVEKTEV